MILQEVVTLLQSLPPGTAGIEQLQAVVARWSQRWPSVQQPTADACLTVIHVRGLLLDALMQEWPRDQQHQGQTIYQVCAHASIEHAIISLAIKGACPLRCFRACRALVAFISGAHSLTE